jgi:hypothetical protein
MDRNFDRTISKKSQPCVHCVTPEFEIIVLDT